MKFIKASFSVFPLVLSVSDAFVGNTHPKIATVTLRSSPFSHDDEHVKSSAASSATAVITAATILAFGGVNDAVAASVPPPPSLQQQEIMSTASSSQLSSMNLGGSRLSSTEFPSTALSSSSIVTSAVSSNVAAPANAGAITIADINYKGQVPTSEADEYVVIKNNLSKDPVDISGYYVYVASTGTQGPTFTFPKGTVLQAGKTFRIYTNEVHKETGGFTFGSGKAIWRNAGGLAVLKDASGKKIMEYKYVPTTPTTTPTATPTPTTPTAAQRNK